MNQSDMQRTDERVNWWAVIGGVLVGAIIGVPVGAGGGMLGMFLTPTTNGRMANAPFFLVGAGILALAAVFYVLWILFRRQNLSFAKGVLIGGCVALLATGACNALVGMMSSQGGH